MKQSSGAQMETAAADWQNGGFGLYIHWPYCQAKCPYCDFNSHVARQIDHDRWQAALVSEIERVAALTEGRLLRSVFFGGGTPSLMPPELVVRLIERIRAQWRQENQFEVTLEANPTSSEAARFAGFRDAGVNRVSIGLQSLRDDHLRALGRLHSAREGLEAYELARKIFPRVSFDLIYARQNQTPEHWRNELSEALALAPTHLSLYQLTIEEGTAFGDRYRRGTLRGLPDEDTGAELFDMTQELCEASGLGAYEVSNHARTEHESLHNRVYWAYGDYAGVGPGAHGRLTLGGTRHATQAIANPGAWLKAVEERGTGDQSVEPLTREDEAAECLMMGMRLREGVSLTRLSRFSGTLLNEQKVRDLEESGHVERVDGRLRASENGRRVLNAVLRYLL